MDFETFFSRKRIYKLAFFCVSLFSGIEPLRYLIYADFISRSFLQVIVTSKVSAGPRFRKFDRIKKEQPTPC